MPTNVVFNGTTYGIPSSGELSWSSLSAFLIDVGNNAAVSEEMKQAIRVATTSPVTVSSSTDCTVVTDLSVAGAVTVNLPAGANKQLFIIVDGKGDALTNNITINRNGSDTIAGATSLVLNHNRQTVFLQYHAATTDWKILANVTAPADLDGKQPLDATLTALAGYNTNGIITQTAADTFTGRTITAGSSKVSVTNGSGVSGNPTVDVTESNILINNLGGTPLSIATGGTGQITATAAFDALAPTTTNGDLIYHNGTDNVRLPIGTDGQALTVSSGVPSWAAVTPTLDSSVDQLNLALSCSVGSSALTIALKDKAGSDPSVGSPVKIAFRNSTATNGTYNARSVTSSLSVVVSSGSTLGHSSGVASDIFIYAIDNAGTVELAVSSTLFETFGTKTTTAEGGAGAADSATVLYSTTARSNVPVRLLGKLVSTQTTAGTWAAVPTETALGAKDLSFGKASGSQYGLITSYAPLVRSSVLSTSSSTTIIEGDGYDTVIVSASGGVRDITLPAVGLSAGRTIRVIKSDSSSNRVRVIPASGTISGASGYALFGQYASVAVTCDGSNWFLSGEDYGSYGKWTGYTPSVLTGFTNFNGNAELKWRRVGGSIEVLGTLGTTTVDSAEARLELPVGLATLTQARIGQCGWYLRAGSQSNKGGAVLLTTTSNLYVVFSAVDLIGSATMTTNAATTGSGTGLGGGGTIHATIPVDQFTNYA